MIDEYQAGIACNAGSYNANRNPVGACIAGDKYLACQVFAKGIPTRLTLLRKHQLKLNTQRPVSDNIGLYGVVIDLRIEVHRLLANTKYSSHAAAERNRPTLVT
jgi:hypothetical protein